MIPHHGDRQGQTGDPKFNVQVDATSYGSNTEITVAIKGAPYTGFLLQARSVGCGCDKPVGTWIESPANTKTMSCSEAEDSMTHNEPTLNKEAYEYKWRAPNEPVGDVEFVVTILEIFDTFWITQKSEVITGSGESVCCACIQSAKGGLFTALSKMLSQQNACF
ncbi:putative defense protein 3 [Glandiceps talaboti]